MGPDRERVTTDRHGSHLIQSPSRIPHTQIGWNLYSGFFQAPYHRPNYGLAYDPLKDECEPFMGREVK